MDQIEKTISNFIEQQFPAFYREHGPIFVEFVKQYYKWLETEQVIVDPSFRYSNKKTLTVSAKSANVTGRDTTFTEDFANGDQIAVYVEEIEDDTDLPDYDIFTINTVANDTFLTLSTSKLPTFSLANANFSTVMDQSNPLHFSRRILDYRDIDLTTEDFLLYFKEKYLKNIQLETTSNTRQLLKHVLDVYRAKGTERALDLLFRIVFGVGASVYYPGQDLFRLSDGKWHQPTYLEVSLNENLDKLVNKQIVGLTSGATAFVEAVVRRTVQGRLIDVLYISALNGDFEVGELINSQSKVLDRTQMPVIIGSLTSLTLSTDGIGENLEIGDIVDITSANGAQGKGRVANTSDTTGLVSFTLVNGGYAYTNNSEVLVSEKILTVNNVTTDASNLSNTYFYLFDHLYQPYADMNYVELAGGTLSDNMLIYTYHANNLLKGTGRIINCVSTNSTAGSVRAAILSGNLNADNFYGTSNTISANGEDFVEKTAHANVMYVSTNATLFVSDVTGTFEEGEEVYQETGLGVTFANGLFDVLVTDVGANGYLYVTNTFAEFITGNTIYGRTSGATANLQYINLRIGVIDVTNTFISNSNNYVYANGSLTNCEITNITSGSGATFEIANTLDYEATITLNDDFLADYASVALNASAYNFSGDPTANIADIIEDALGYTEYTIGKINHLVSINKGADYTGAPFVLIFEPRTAIFCEKDIILDITGATGAFETEELVTQSATGARGLVKTANDTHVTLERLRILDANNFVVTSNSTTTIVGESSSVQANVTVVGEEYHSRFLGMNALVDTEVQSSPGAATEIDIIDSGFGYIQGETVEITSDETSVGTAVAVLEKQGQARGYYKQKGGFLSDTKKLFDGLYYQEYSYEVRSSVTLNKYVDMLKQILHVAGTKYYGALVYSSIANSAVDIKNVRMLDRTIEEADDTFVSNALNPPFELNFTANTAWNSGATTLPTLLTCSRGSNGYYTHANGFMTLKSSNVLRYGDRGLLVEPTATNLIQRSFTYGHADWNVDRLTLSGNSVTAPDGTNTASSFRETVETGAHVVYQDNITISSGTTYCASVFVRPINRDFIYFYFTDSVFTDYITTVFDCGNGTVSAATNEGTTSTAVNSGIQELTDGWYRIWLAGSHLDTSCWVWLEDGNHLGNANNGYDLWGFQLETGSTPTSYIPTNGATAQRNADDVYIATSNIVGHSTTSGTYFVEAEISPYNSGIPMAFESQVAADRGQSIIYTSMQAGGAPGMDFLGAGYSLQAAVGSIGSSSYQTANLAMTGQNNYFMGARDGTLASSADTSGNFMPTAHTRLVLGAGSSYLGAHIKRFKYWPRLFSNSELQTITS